MSEGLNKVLLFGNLGAEPELKVFGGGSGSVLKLRLACSESYFDKSKQEWTEKTEWINVAVWGKRGEALAKFMKKGDRVFIEGSLRTSSYEKNGQKHWRTEVHATNVILGGSTQRKTTKESPAGEAAPPPPMEDFGDFPRTEDDDIPF